MSGSARLLLAAPDTWAFAIGYAPSDAPAAVRDAVRRFTASLEPTEPRYYARAFRAAADLDAVVFRKGDEPPLKGVDLAAVALILEAGGGMRVPLAARKHVHDMLREDAAANTPAGRKAYREATAAFGTWDELPAEERETGLRRLGQRMLEAQFERANEAHPPAMRFAVLWRHLRGVAVGTGEDGLSVGDLGSLNEMSAFLASVAADEEIRLEGERGAELQEELKGWLAERWTKIDESEKEAWRASGATWAHLRRAFDLAPPGLRAAFRRAVAAELAPEGSRERVSSLDPGRPLMAWMHAQRGEGRDVELVTRAFQLTPTARAELIGLLGVEEKPHQLGW